VSQGISTEVSKELIAIESDDPIYFYEQMNEARKSRLKSKARKFRIFRGNLIEDIR
jgi:hypothetical protein